MSDAILLVRLDRSDDRRIRALAPEVGWWFEIPAAGTLVGPGSAVGRLRRLNRTHRLVLPAGTAGTVETIDGDHVRPVGFGDELFAVRSLGDQAIAGAASGGERVIAEGTDDREQGMHAVTAPTDGVFYRRPSPDAPPYVEVGDRVSTGQPVGLVEVMKTFNQIVYDGPGFPSTAEVVEIRCEDGEEVSSGQMLVIVR